ncbi:MULTISPECIES: hypothetical protein [Halobacterium]|uniref:DUF7322 domain-containing protein n=3 Tax=Halobacterium salinarum TaxID=2242 RepID=A0A510N516_HALSA|nr:MULTISPECIES: hypothetical protein [Halobacterium]MBB6089883.1 hypothetical protein [Halobacterium salinarum]MCF2165611.1 hypothetical protein [Halobacterium salinarum]MCF2168887.1 hypothetical protein [Halobacterium salinarum]MCF2207805.1 hypothetical protein [Halobacterium salinarum]MCF2238907.1 hypothetical protein [Halobacterium salinarum]
MLDDVPFADEESEAEQDLAPDIEIPDGSAADPTLQRKFWSLVLVFNAAVLAGSVGAMIAWFNGNWGTGGPLLAAAVILSVYGGYKYRVYTRKD